MFDVDTLVPDCIAAIEDPDPQRTVREPCDYEQIRQAFAAANEDWKRQVGEDLDESAS